MALTKSSRESPRVQAIPHVVRYLATFAIACFSLIDGSLDYRIKTMERYDRT